MANGAGARYEEWWVNPPDYTGTLISGTAEVAFMVICGCGCVCVFVCNYRKLL